VDGAKANPALKGVKSYVGNIEKQTLKDNYFREVLFTGKKPN
jgi:hypothetical protein